MTPEDEIARLRAGIKSLSETANICVFHLLGEVCEGCRCYRNKNIATAPDISDFHHFTAYHDGRPPD